MSIVLSLSLLAPHRSPARARTAPSRLAPGVTAIPARCERCTQTVDSTTLTCYADERLCTGCVVRVRDTSCYHCGGEKSPDPMRELCDPCVADGFGYR